MRGAEIDIRDPAVWWDLRHDLLGFVELALPLGEPGWFEAFKPADAEDKLSGLWPWQRKFLADYSIALAAEDWGPDAEGVVAWKPPRKWAIVSGTGTGKTAFVLPSLICHALCCYRGMKGIAMSASGTNLETKLLAATKAMVQQSPVLSQMLGWRRYGPYRLDDPEGTNYLFTSSGTESGGAGTHGTRSMSHQTVDQAEGTREASWMGAAGARDDNQSIQVIAGNPWETGNWFRDRYDGAHSSTWNVVRVSRKTDCGPWTLKQDEEALAAYGGESSPHYRANVLGLPALRSQRQFIPQKLLEQAASLPVLDEMGEPLESAETPCVVGMDIARGGRAFNCAVWCRGTDARSVLPEQVRGDEMSTDELAAWALDVATRPRPPFPAPSRVYFDATGERDFANALRFSDAGSRFVPVDFAGADPSGKHHQMRGALWTGLLSWFGHGGRIRNDPGLIRTIGAAREIMVKGGKPGIIPKDEIRRRAGHAHLDEVDALLLAVRQPPARRYVERRRTPPLMRRPRGYGF